MLQNYDIDINEFVKFTNAGVQIADYTQVRSALINRYKAVYGEDIDLSTGTADGVWVSNLALIMNNMLQTIKSLYSMLNINEATGIYLDNLCALSNIVRKKQTASTASINVTNNSSTSLTLASGTIFIDQSSTEWVYYGESIIIDATKTSNIVVRCSTLGPVEAPIGWIVKTLEVSSFTVDQPTVGIPGQRQETDADLRARRAQSSGSVGSTVLESLVGSLLELSGIRDAKIVNATSATTASDGTSLAAHSVYIITRVEQNVQISDDTVGQLIYDKLTPGILTNETADTTNGISKSVSIAPLSETDKIDSVAQTIYWKQAKSVVPQIQIVLNTFEYFTEQEISTISNSMISYLNDLQIGTSLTAQDILIQASYADPQFLSKPTYSVSSAKINDTTSYENKLTYYNYSSFSFTNAGNAYTITLS